VREMQGPDGGYFSATDADSEGEEGKFFVWALDEIQALLERDAAEHFAFFYDVTAEGNWEEKNVLWRRRSLAEAATALGVKPEALEASLAESKKVLYEARLKRVPPLLDDKVIAAWNGLMIGAMAEGFRVLRDRRYLESAERAANYVWTTLRRPDGGLFRTARAGRAHLDACLEDYAYVADAFVTLYEAGGALAWLDRALELAERIVSDFSGDGGAFFATAKSHKSSSRARGKVTTARSRTRTPSPPALSLGSRAISIARTSPNARPPRSARSARCSSVHPARSRRRSRRSTS
jgi:uncharacterized protein